MNKYKVAKSALVKQRPCLLAQNDHIWEKMHMTVVKYLSTTYFL